MDTEPGELPTQVSPQESRASTMSRREFLNLTRKTLAAAGLAAAVGSSATNIQSGEGLRSHENLTPLNNTMLIDFAPERATKGINQGHYPNNSEIAKRLLGEHYMTNAQLITEFGYEFVRQGLNPLELYKKVIEKYPNYGLVQGGLQLFSRHGEEISNAHRTVLNRLGYDATPYIEPLQEGFEEGDITFDIQDQFGNSGVELRVDADDYINKLRSSSHKVVNLSFQLGKLRMMYLEERTYIDVDLDRYNEIFDVLKAEGKAISRTDGKESVYHLFDAAKHKAHYSYDGPNTTVKITDIATGQDVTSSLMSMTEAEYDKFRRDRRLGYLNSASVLKTEKTPRFDIRGAYSGEDGYENVLELVKLANSCPDKLFVSAAGNYGDDLRPIRASLEANGSWPDNLLIAAQWNGVANQPLVYSSYVHGADLYVDNKALGFEAEGSSISTAALSAAASILEKKGLTIEEIKKHLLSSSDEVEYLVNKHIPYDELTQERFVQSISTRERDTAHVFNMKTFQERLANDKSH